MDMTFDEANKLWDDLRSALNNFERTLSKIIADEAWLPLGYNSLSEAWQDRMAGTRLTTAIAQAYLVYELLDEGMTEDEILATAGAGSGIGPSSVRTLARQYRIGVPAALATNRERTVVGPFERSNTRSAAQTVHVSLTPDEYEHFAAIAKRRNLDLADESAKAIRQWFNRLERAFVEPD